MEIIKQSAEIIHVSHPQPLNFIERVARTCYKSHDKTKPGSAERMARQLLESGHHSMLEFVDVVVEYTTDRAMSHEIVRHRPVSYAQESQRWVRYYGGIKFIEPEGYDANLPAWKVWGKSMQQAEDAYLEMLAYGCTPQQARKVLPNSAATVIVMKTNLREWMHFFSLRTAKNADPHMQELAGTLLQAFQATIPILLD
jgi:thymidylate synthase (FAD)